MKYVMMAAALLAGGSLYAQNSGKPFKLDGTVTAVPKDSVFLSYTDAAGKFVHAKQAIKNERFSFSGSIEGPESASLSFESGGKSPVRFFIEPGTMTLLINPAEPAALKLSGSKTQLDLEAYDKFLAPVNQKSKPLYAELKTEKDPEARKALRKKVAPFEKEANELTYAFFKSHPDSYVTAYMLQMYGMMVSFDSLKTIYNALSPELKQRKIVKAMGAQIAAKDAASPGNTAKDFTATDVNGKTLSLADFKGKYVLLDFWASWCVPCRKSHPHLREIYSKYKNRGLEIIGIADDGPRPAIWRTAIAQDSIGAWRHVLDGGLMLKYGVNALPTKFLIDPKGKIIAKFIGDGGAEIDREINKVFKDSLPDEEAKLLRERLKPLEKRYYEQYAQYGTASDEEIKKVQLDFISTHPNSRLSLQTLKEYAGGIPEAEKTLVLFGRLGKELQESAEGKTFRDYLQNLVRLDVGKPAPEFSQADTSGKLIALSAYRGKYVLVDFWASWCKPCRAENPNLVASYARFHSRGLEILGVSLDQPTGKAAWMKAIHDDKLTWAQVSDLKYWKNEAAVLYAVRAVPQNYLIDPSGKIVAKNLRGEELDKKLAELLEKGSR